MQWLLGTAQHLAGQVDERPAAVAAVDGRVGLDELAVGARQAQLHCLFRRGRNLSLTYDA